MRSPGVREGVRESLRGGPLGVRVPPSRQGAAPKYSSLCYSLAVFFPRAWFDCTCSHHASPRATFLSQPHIAKEPAPLATARLAQKQNEVGHSLRAGPRLPPPMFSLPASTPFRSPHHAAYSWPPPSGSNPKSSEPPSSPLIIVIVVIVWRTSAQALGLSCFSS